MGVALWAASYWISCAEAVEIASTRAVRGRINMVRERWRRGDGRSGGNDDDGGKKKLIICLALLILRRLDNTITSFEAALILLFTGLFEIGFYALAGLPIPAPWRG
jgi:hypothetical protein